MTDVADSREQQRKNRNAAIVLAIVAVMFFVAFLGAQILRSQGG